MWSIEGTPEVYEGVPAVQQSYEANLSQTTTPTPGNRVQLSNDPDDEMNAIVETLVATTPTPKPLSPRRKPFVAARRSLLNPVTDNSPISNAAELLASPVIMSAEKPTVKASCSRQNDVSAQPLSATEPAESRGHEEDTAKNGVTSQNNGLVRRRLKDMSIVGTPKTFEEAASQASTLVERPTEGKAVGSKNPEIPEIKRTSTSPPDDKPAPSKKATTDPQDVIDLTELPDTPPKQRDRPNLTRGRSLFDASVFKSYHHS